MPERRRIRVVDLLYDEENPRLAEPNAGQRGALKELAKKQERKILALAEDIAKFGMNPADLPIVMAKDEDSPWYIVLEGNRRLCALRALETPEAFTDLVGTATARALRSLSKKTSENRIESLECFVVDSREEADHWVDLRHGGEREGAGIVPWGAAEKERFKERTSGSSEPYKQALDFLERGGFLDSKKRADVPVTNMQRLINTPAVRQKLGLEVRKKELFLIADPTRVGNALMHVVDDLVSQRIKVGDIIDIERRRRYADSLPRGVAIPLTQRNAKPISATSVGISGAKAKPILRPNTARGPRQRECLIGPDCTLSVSDKRIKAIEQELRKLNMRTYTNAVSVLFRVFVELSADYHIKTAGLKLPNDPTLGAKLAMVVADLLTRKKLNAQQAKPVRQAAQKGSYMGASITLMNDYVHNAAMFPAPGDLEAHWNSLQPFIAAIW